jgi:uncharacterized damage-inducible protein DinB
MLQTPAPRRYASGMDRDELLSGAHAFVPPAQILAGVSAEDAARRIAGVSHSIVEIVAHLVFWQNWLISRCSGVAIPAPAHAPEGWPAAAAADWEPMRREFIAGSDRARRLPAEGRIDPPIESPPMAAYTIADALVHLSLHNAHHLGQIVILRQALGAWPPPDGGFTW